ncbi:response regulator transcription factor [candidate division KSB1 bacterium]|nr:response regulator transcription factor [candidate division KSB1 bacterium]
MKPSPDKTHIRTLVVDDEPLAREGLKELLARAPDVEIVGECRDGFEAITALESARVDLLFLDVQMPELNGFEVLAALSEEQWPAVIFVTAYDEYALRAFEVHAVDYLLKPLDPDRFHAALARARDQIKWRAEQDMRQKLGALFLDLKNQHKPLERVLIRTGGRLWVVKTNEVDWISAEADYACLHVQGKKHLLRETLSVLEKQLDPQKFLRVHRSTIVNLDRIQAMESLSHGEMVLQLKDGTKLTASRNYRAKLAEVFHNMI